MTLQSARAVGAVALRAISLLALTSVLALAQSNGFKIKPLVKQGDPVSDGGRFFPCDGCEARVIGLHALNTRGDVAIGAEASGNCLDGNFLISGGVSIRLGDFCQQTPFGKFGLLGSVNINERSQAAMQAGLPVDGRLDGALFLYSGGQLTKLVQERDPMPIGGIFKGCGFGEPAINNNGDVAFFACGEKDGFFFGDGVYLHSGGQISKVVAGEDPSPIGGTFALNFIPAQAVQMNDAGDVLFQAGVIFLDLNLEKLGLFLKTTDGIRKIEIDGDPLPSGGKITTNVFGLGDLNQHSDVALAVSIQDNASGSGIFLSSGDRLSKIMTEGDSTPIGGKFQGIFGRDFLLPRINSNRAVAFRNSVTGGSSPAAIFLASPSAMIKVAAVGDSLPSGGKIKEITTFALNDLGEIAFYANVKNGPNGVFLASPQAPQITSIKLKRKKGVLELRVNGNAMITNDTLIEINGLQLANVEYPSDFQEDGGTVSRVVSRDPRLDSLLPPGQTAQVTVFNSLTNLRSSAKTFAR